MKVSSSSLTVSLLTLSLLALSLVSISFVLVLSQDDLEEVATSNSYVDHAESSPPDWDEFGDSDPKSDHELDPGSWCLIFEPDSSSYNQDAAKYYAAVEKMLAAAAGGEVRGMEEAVARIEALAVETGNPHAQSVLGFLYGLGQMRERSKARSFLFHYFAADGGNLHSKMVLAFTYSREEMHDKAVKLYAELAEVTGNRFLISKNSPVIEPIRIHNGAEESMDALRKSQGDEDEDFQILEYQAWKGNAAAMYKVGLFHYFGLRGLRHDHGRALAWFSKAVEGGEPRSMELLGEIYARGVGVERNYTKALEWLTLASKQQLYSAYNSIGYLYVMGYGVDKDYTKGKEYFEVAADNDDAGRHYNLGVMYLKGLGVKRNVKLACKFFIMAANAGQPKAFYQLAKMFHTGVGLKKNLPMATAPYKLVAERGPWSFLVKMGSRIIPKR